MTSRLCCALLLVLAAPRVHAQPFPETKLVSSDGSTSDLFGRAVALSADGRTALISASADDDRGGSAGSAYVFARSGGAWTEHTKLLASDGGTGDNFGWSVALSADGQVALVGARNDDDGGFSGSAYVFVRSGDAWVEQAKLTGSVGVGAFGASVALSAGGEYALIGAPNDDNGNGVFTGSAYVFVRNGSVWVEQAKLTGSDSADDDRFGTAVALSADGQRALVGAQQHADEGAYQGSAYVFARNGDAWAEQAELLASDGGGGEKFGEAVALSASGQHALIGAPSDAEGGLLSGSAYVFLYDGGAWVEQAKLTASDAGSSALFGEKVALSADGDRALIGASGVAVGSPPGRAYVFARGSGAWVEQAKLTASDGTDEDQFGSAVAFDAEGQYALVGAERQDGIEDRAGSAYVYDLRSSAPSPTPGAPYVYTLGNESFDEGTDVGLDAAGNAVFLGEFDGTLDFDPGPGVAELTSTQTDVYVASYDAAGALRFAFPIGNGHATSEEAGGIAVNEAGWFVVTGRQPFGAIDFDPDSTKAAPRTGKLFVAGYHADGRFRFAVAPEGGGGADGVGRDVAFDTAGHVYVTGRFQGTLNFAPGAPQASSLTSNGPADAFVASYTSDGAHRFAFQIGDTGVDTGAGIAVDAAGNMYVTGRRSIVPSGRGMEEGAAAGSGESAFLASYAPDGTERFLHLLGYADGASSAGRAIALDAAGNVYLAGSFTGAIPFDPNDTDGDGDHVEVTESAGGSAFLASYTSDGAFRFATVPEGAAVARGLTILGSGISYVTGSFADAVDFDPGAGDATLVAPDGTYAFVASYDADGAYRRAFGFGGDGLCVGSGVAADEAENVVLAGWYSATADFDLGAGVDMRTSAGQDDLFMMKVGPEDASSPVAVEEPESGPLGAALSAAYPNPFGQQARLTLALARSEHARVSVLDVLGREVRVLHDGVLAAGAPHALVLSADGLSSGLYVVRVVTPTLAESRRVIVQR